MKRCTAKPYEGQEKYIFVSYCHKDRAQVFPIIEQLTRDGYRVWYDEGIDPGTEWPEIIASHLNGSAICIAFITENSINSHNCRREINFALLKKKYFISVVLEPVEMPLGMEMQLSSSQSIFKFKLNSDKEFFTQLYRPKELENCKGEPNYSIVVSSPEEYAVDPNAINKVRDPFSDVWFKEEAERKAAEEAARKAKEEAERKAAEEAARKAKEEAERKAAEEAARKAEEEAERKAAEEAARKAEEEAERKAAEEAARKAKEEAERKAAEEAALKAKEEAERKAAEEAALKAKEEAERKAAEEAARKAEEEAKHKAAEVRYNEAEDSLNKTIFMDEEEEARKKAEELRRKIEEAARKAAEEAEKARKKVEIVSIHMLKREMNGEIVNVDKTPFVLGRSETADYVIDNNRSISRSHATLVVRDDVCYIVDNKSMNKTYVNGVVLTPEQEHVLENGDSVKLHNEKFVYLKYHN